MKVCSQCICEVRPKFWIKSGGLCEECAEKQEEAVDVEGTVEETEWKELTQLAEVRPSPLVVNVDWEVTVQRHQGDVNAALIELGLLKDVLA